MKRVVPCLRYDSASEALLWLEKAFGFAVTLSVPGEDGRVEHARLVAGDVMIMVASTGREGPIESLYDTPANLGRMTQGLYLQVDDADRVYQSACDAGAEIVEEIHDFDFGGRLFSCRDPEGYVWSIGSNDPFADSSES